MADQEEPWPRHRDFPCTLEGCASKVCPCGRAYVIICGSWGLRQRAAPPQFFHSQNHCFSYAFHRTLQGQLNQ